MKSILTINLLIILSIILAGCGTSPEAAPVIEASLPAPVMSTGSTPTPFAAAYLNTEFEDAANLRNQLAFGILQLEGSEQAVTVEQAGQLLPLWQAIVALSGTETTAEEELSAVQNQIVEGLLPAQLEAIAAMEITNADLTAFYVENGIILSTPIPGETKEPGKDKTLSQEDREATKTAASALGTPVGTGSGSGQAARTLLFEKVIELLTALITP